MTTVKVPIPVRTADTEPYWEACDRGEFVLQRCNGCGFVRPVPRPGCDFCGPAGFEWVPVPTTGTVYSFTEVNHPIHPAFREVPYAVVVLEMDEVGAHVVSKLEGAQPGDVKIGSRARLEFVEIEGGGRLPYARLL